MADSIKKCLHESIRSNAPALNWGSKHLNNWGVETREGFTEDVGAVPDAGGTKYEQSPGGQAETPLVQLGLRQPGQRSGIFCQHSTRRLWESGSWPASKDMWQCLESWREEAVPPVRRLLSVSPYTHRKVAPRLSGLQHSCAKVLDLQGCHEM